MHEFLPHLFCFVMIPHRLLEFSIAQMFVIDRYYVCSFDRMHFDFLIRNFRLAFLAKFSFLDPRNLSLAYRLLYSFVPIAAFDCTFVRCTPGDRVARNPFKDVRECSPVRIRTGGEGTTGCA